jgi:hypothetical protein
MSWQTLVGYLEKAEPASIASLRAAYPDADRLLSSALEFGAAAEAEKPPQAFDRAASIALLKASATQLKADIDDLVSTMKSRMQLVRRIRLGSAIVSTVTGAISAILALLARVKQWSNEEVAVGVAVITMIGGLLALFADHFERTPVGVKFAGVEELTALVDLRTEVEKISIRANQDALIPWSDAEIVTAANLINEVALKVLRLRYLSPG